MIHRTGPALVLAGPGSGKTFVLTNRIAHLIEHYKVNPGSILVITFTKAAALEMQYRAYQINPRTSQVQFGTFHSIFLEILLSSLEYQNISVINSEEKYNFLKQILYHFYYTKEDVEQHIPIFMEKISYFYNTSDENIDLEYFLEVKEEYQLLCRKNKKIDFDQILYFCYELIKKDQNLAEKLKKQYKYILIDEFQDCNEIQYEVTKRLVNEEKNIFVVGDDDQAIYSFRGSNPKYMKQFLEDYKNSEVIHLKTNYRCNCGIVEMSMKFIEHNQFRIEKRMVSNKNDVTNPVNVWEALSITNEMEEINKKIAKIEKNATEPVTIGILFRTMRKCNLYKEAILVDEKTKRNGKEDKSYEEVLYNEILSDLYHYFQYFFEGNKRSDFISIMNKPQRYISKRLLEKETTVLEEIRSLYLKQMGPIKDGMGNIVQNNNELLNNINHFIFCRDLLVGLDSYGALYCIVEQMGYGAYIRERMECSKDNCSTKEMLKKGNDLLEKIYDVARKNKKPREFIELLLQKRNGKQEQKSEPLQGYQKNNKNVKLFFMTYHSSKGLEFDYVFLPGINMYAVPHKKAKHEEEIEEERRMFYVAMTRAKRELNITYIKNDAITPSFFIDELK